MSGFRFKRDDAVLLAAVLLLTALVYLPALPGAIFVYDDVPLMLEAPAVVDGPALSSFLRFENGRPLTLLSFHADRRIWGESAIAFRAFNIGLHLLATALLFLVVRRASSSRTAAFLASLLFAMHPLQVQPVSYIWSRSMLLMAVFSLGAILARRRPVWILVLFQLAIFSRTEALALALPLFLIQRNAKARMATASLAGANLAGLVLGMMQVKRPGIAWAYADPLTYWSAAPGALLAYFRMFLWPTGLAIDHQFSPAVPVDWLAGFALVTALAGAAALCFRRSPLAAACLLWPLLWLAPSLLIPNADVFNESRAYLALAGPATLAALGLARALSSGPGRLAVTALTLFLAVVLAGRTAGRTTLWNDEVALWREAATQAPGNAHAHYNLGAALARSDDVGAAELAFLEALKLDQNHDRALAGIGYCREWSTDRQGAEWYYQEALRLNPANEYARQQLARMDMN